MRRRQNKIRSGCIFEWLGEKHSDSRLKRAATGIDRAVNKVLQDNKVRTPDIGGSASTQKVGNEIAAKIKSVAHDEIRS